jgi:hypothetical protein
MVRLTAVWPPAGRNAIWPFPILYARWDGFAMPSPLGEFLWVMDDGSSVVTDEGQEVKL